MAEEQKTSETVAESVVRSTLSQCCGCGCTATDHPSGLCSLCRDGEDMDPHPGGGDE